MLRVVVVYAADGAECIVTVDLPDASTVADAVEQSGILPRLALDAAVLGHAIFGAMALPTTPLVDGDRIELTRPLIADPKHARRDRARQGARVLRPKPSRHRPKAAI
jgi:putative ubiquitin-RnfH superfamily antitoxin RatB of RatAB toxin-antitoxin module